MSRDLFQVGLKTSHVDRLDLKVRPLLTVVDLPYAVNASCEFVCGLRTV